jgi:ankyrin repeat protein
LNGDANNDNSRLLWISGGPGKGKTMMSIFLTEELTRHTAASITSDLVFFFCGAGDENRNTAVNLLRGLVHQILEKRPQLIGNALAYFKPPERAKQTLSSLEALWLIFSRLVVDDRLGTIFCVLDGLDECEEETTRSLLRRILDMLAAQCSNKADSLFKLAIVSRDMPVLRGCATVKLDPDNNQEIESDISTFVRSRIKDLTWIEGFEHIQESVQTSLLERAEGTFLWVGFAMHELLQMHTCKQIQETLQILPSGLPAIYGRMLLRIPPSQRDSARTLLQYVAIAVRPLRLLELATTIPLPKSLSQMELEQATRDLIILCGPLLRTEEPKEEPETDVEIVQGHEVNLVHQSVRDYLLRSQRDSNAVLETFRFDKATMHLQLAQRCLDCLEQKELQRGEPPRLENLLPYAMLHWPEHAKNSSALATKLFKSHKFFQPKNHALRGIWWEFYGYRLIRAYRIIPCPPLLHMACILGLKPLVEVVLGQQDWRLRMHRRINEKHERIDTPLHIAVRQGDFALVRLLLQKGANCNIRDKSGRELLPLACIMGNEAVVRLLMDNGADPIPRSPNFNQLLRWAAHGNNTAIVQLLLDRGARHTEQDWDIDSALRYATVRDNEAMAEFLIKKGADFTGRREPGLSLPPLHHAAHRRSVAIAKLLIDRGADVDARSAEWTTPLHEATGGTGGMYWIAPVAVIQLLLDCGADIDAKDMDGNTALLRAAIGLEEEALRVLLDRGADTKTKNLSGHGLLYEAAKPNKMWKQDDQRKTMQMLILRGADVEELNNEEEAAAYRNCKRLLGERLDEWEALDFYGKPIRI